MNMSSVDQATQTQLNNIQKKTGKSLAELARALQASGLSKHGELRAFAQRELGLGYGDANTLAHAALRPDGASAAESSPPSDVLDGIYSGEKASLRPIHEAVMKEIVQFGEFESAPKKGYLSLRRKKQFAMLGPATRTRVELGLNARGLPSSSRLLEQPKGSMCNYIVRLTDAGEVDAELVGWVRAAYEAAG